MANPQVRRAVKMAKLRHPLDIILMRKGIETPDFSTGEKGASDTLIAQCVGVMLTSTIRTMFVNDLAYIGAARTFTEGGLFMSGDRWLLLDQEDLPDGYIPDKDDYVIFNGIRHEVSHYRSIQEGQALFLRVKETEGAEPRATYYEIASDVLLYGESTTGV